MIGSYLISIPQWCDKNSKASQLPYLPLSISIPQWCDKNMLNPAGIAAGENFNSSMVR